MNYLTQVVETIRVPNVNEVEKLHTELKNSKQFELKKFEYQHKDIKQKGEIVDEYELVKATLIFNTEKEPTCHVDINFKISEGFFPEPIEMEDDNIDEY